MAEPKKITGGGGDVALIMNGWLLEFVNGAGEDEPQWSCACIILERGGPG